MRAARDRWLAIEMRHLAALATVARESSFSGAADSLGYVQSAISQQIAYLERIVGRRLVERSARPRSVTLTPAGAALLEHVDRILEQLRLAKLDVDALARRAGRAGSFGIAAVFGAWMPAALLAELLPDTGGEGTWGRVARGPASELLDAVAAGRLDAAFVELPIACGPFSAIELLRDPCMLAVPAGHARSADAALERWSLVAVDDCRATAALRARRPHLRSVHAADSPASALPFVRSGAAAAVVARRDVPAGDRGVATLPLPDVPPRVLGLAWHRDRDDAPALATLRAAARRAFAPRP